MYGDELSVLIFRINNIKISCSTVVPAKSDSDAILCLQSLSKILTCTLRLSLHESTDHLCISPIHRIGLIHK